MFDYGTIDDLLKNTEHIEILRNNSLQDDGTDTVKGVDWFQYKGKTASTLYVSGNSWIGFGENTEQLKIVRRDTDLMTLRREEGTIWGTYKFLRIRWEGYSVHSNRIDATRMIWDAILFDTGEICTHRNGPCPPCPAGCPAGSCRGRPAPWSRPRQGPARRRR